MSYDLLLFFYSYMYFLYVTWSQNLLKLHSTTCKKTILGGNSWKIEMIAYLHITWPNLAKVMKARVPKDALMKSNHPPQEVMWFLLIWYPDKWKEHMQLLQKLLDIKYDRKKYTENNIYSLGSKFVWQMLHHEIIFFARNCRSEVKLFK